VTQTSTPTKGLLRFVCDDDDCDVSALVPRPDGRWERAERAVEALGWQCIPVAGRWLHYCPKCRTAA